MTLLLEERVTNLEELLAELLRAQARTQRNLDSLSGEMSEYKEEGRRFREENQREREANEREHREFFAVMERDHQEARQEREANEREHREFFAVMERDWQEARQEREANEREHREFSAAMERDRQEWQRFREENQREQRAFRQTLADISHKMGTLAEDMVAPSIPRILEEVVHCPEPPSMLGVRIRKRLRDGRSQEYDVVATCGNYLLISETKSRLRPEDIPNFIETLKTAHTFLPEYADKQVIGALASFYVDPTLVTHGQRQGLIMLGVIDGLMEVLNTAEFKLQTW